MAAINKVILVGNLGRDPETRYMQNGDAVTNFSLATTETWRGKDGEKKEQTEWHSIAVFGKLAEVAEKYLHKGSKVYIEGKLRTRKWQDKDGNDKYTTEVVLSGPGSTMQMLDGKSDASSEPRRTAPQAQGAAKGGDFFDDDVPF